MKFIVLILTMLIILPAGAAGEIEYAVRIDWNLSQDSRLGEPPPGMLLKEVPLQTGENFRLVNQEEEHRLLGIRLPYLPGGETLCYILTPRTAITFPGTVRWINLVIYGRNLDAEIGLLLESPEEVLEMNTGSLDFDGFQEISIRLPREKSNLTLGSIRIYLPPGNREPDDYLIYLYSLENR